MNAKTQPDDVQVLLDAVNHFMHTLEGTQQSPATLNALSVLIDAKECVRLGKDPSEPRERLEVELESWRGGKSDSTQPLNPFREFLEGLKR